VQSVAPRSAAESRVCSRAASGLTRRNAGDLDCGSQAKPLAIRTLALAGSMPGAGHPRRSPKPRQTPPQQTPPRTLQLPYEARKSPGTKRSFFTESGRKSNGSTVSLIPLDAVKFQSGTGTLHKRAASSPIWVTRRLFMCVTTGTSNAVYSARSRGRGCGTVSDADSAAA